jgi:hypothetical protein
MSACKFGKQILGVVMLVLNIAILARGRQVV